MFDKLFSQKQHTLTLFKLHILLYFAKYQPQGIQDKCIYVRIIGYFSACWRCKRFDMKLTTGVHREKWKAFISTRSSSSSNTQHERCEVLSIRARQSKKAPTRSQLNIAERNTRARTSFCKYVCVRLCVYIHCTYICTCTSEWYEWNTHRRFGTGYSTKTKTNYSCF